MQKIIFLQDLETKNNGFSRSKGVFASNYRRLEALPEKKSTPGKEIPPSRHQMIFLGFMPALAYNNHKKILHGEKAESIFQMLAISQCCCRFGWSDLAFRSFSLC